jgi:hypothetical protein
VSHWVDPFASSFDFREMLEVLPHQRFLTITQDHHACFASHRRADTKHCSTLGCSKSAPEMIMPDYGQGFTRRTPIPLNSSSSCSRSQQSSIWDSCSTTDTSLSSLPDSTSQTVDSKIRHKEKARTGSFPGGQVARQPNPIDAEENIWEVDTLLGKWTRGVTTWYLVKWKGFADKDST